MARHTPTDDPAAAMLPEPLGSASPVIAASKAARLALNRRQQAFVENYGRLGTKNGEPALNAAEAARKAGYSERCANRMATKLLRRPDVKAAVDLIRKEVAERASYTIERCMGELESGMEFALKTENASAYVRAVELRGKLTGLLVDRLDARVAIGGIDFAERLKAARQRQPASAGSAAREDDILATKPLGERQRRYDSDSGSEASE